MDFSSQTILLAEDNEDDVFIFQRALAAAKITNPLQIVNDGESTLAYLAGTGGYADRIRFPVPMLVMLDLKMPRVNGLEILKWIREQRHLDGVSVVVLTSSAEERDITRAYQLGARSYLVKPPTAATLTEMLNASEVKF